MRCYTSTLGAQKDRSALNLVNRTLKNNDEANDGEQSLGIADDESLKQGIFLTLDKTFSKAMQTRSFYLAPLIYKWKQDNFQGNANKVLLPGPLDVQMETADIFQGNANKVLFPSPLNLQMETADSNSDLSVKRTRSFLDNGTTKLHVNCLFTLISLTLTETREKKWHLIIYNSLALIPLGGSAHNIVE